MLERDLVAQLILKCKLDFWGFKKIPIFLRQYIFKHMIIFYYHLDGTDQLNIEATANEFICAKESHQHIVANF